jgi:uracil-DNA glycosylase family 4
VPDEKPNLAHELLRSIRAERREEPPEDIAPSSGNETAGNLDKSTPSQTTSSEGMSETQDEEDPSDQERLDQLEEEVSGCTRCDLSESRTQVVFADGTSSAQIFVIGEGPGAQEDEEGIPFVGRSGQLLRRGFEKVGLDEDRIYITNTVKCRPPENRGPRESELDACRPYLDEQFELVDPDVVLALGSFAIEYCLEGDQRVGECRGKVHEWRGTDLVPTYHPAYILRNNNQAQTFIDDLVTVRSLIQPS